ncbi:TPMT family class I SAM-dependent methyltransferase [Christiangramia sediminis]|uniref:TPMT family class I SAM-dependent methyltransferase n=1 Tax=Christiangramia sediminis TaxID=2881336 RepID=A0A9X1LIT0_9FLAO|nr:TPMT family class I SAM-dependent methyltransferase [Christiangramia sediminis]MCB7480959.1 TPMT family class I SAM-dependent methyltransferase [Christiangramia sediminis]
MNKEFWSSRYKENNTGWDVGQVSTPLKEYIDQLQDKNLKILIPGAGNSYEAEYLFKKGFRNIWICDIAKEPIVNFKKRLPQFPESQILNVDFFELNDQFDLILEQTFFCALPVDLRPDYAEKSSELLKSGAKLCGLLFDFPLSPDGPPFGGSKEEYLTYFSPYFKINIFERCYNSIKPRQGKELFFNFSKK